MPMLINIRRIRLFLAFIQQRSLLDGTRTFLGITVAGTANEFHIISHHVSATGLYIIYQE
tara:strand:+ start:201 stop:380 length:180 start_codon:yes stop_codon:yes gene_type:complete